MSGTVSEVMRLMVVVLIAGNVLAFAAGVSLLVAPRSMTRWLGMKAAHPLTIRRLTKPLERSRDGEAIMLRYPRILGVAMFAGGIFVLVKWIFFFASLTRAEGGRVLTRFFPATIWPSAVWEVAWVFLLVLVLIGSLLAIGVGALALVRVQTLKQLSNFSNRWISTRQAVKPIARPYYGIDRFVAERPQIWGAAIAVISLYTLVMTVWFAHALTR